MAVTRSTAVSREAARQRPGGIARANRAPELIALLLIAALPGGTQ